MTIKKINPHIFLVIIMIALLQLLSVHPVLAVPTLHTEIDGWNPDGVLLQTIKHGTVNGGIYVGGGHGMEYTTSYTQNFTVPNGTVKWARLYVSAKDTPWLNVSLNGHLLGNYTDLTNNSKVYSNYKTDDHGMCWAYYDNVDEWIVNGTNTATADLGSRVGLNTKSWGIMLIAVYEGGDRLELIEYWVNEGNPLLHGDHPPFAWHRNSTNTSFTDISNVNNVSNMTSATLWTVYIWGSEESEPDPHDTLWFNSNLVAEDASDGAGTDDQGNSWRGACFDLVKWDVTLSLDRNNVILYDRGKDSILCPVGAVLVITRSSEPAAASWAVHLDKQILPLESLEVTPDIIDIGIFAPEWQSDAQMLTNVTPGNLNFSVQVGGLDTKSLFVVNTGTEVSSYKVYVDEDYVDWFDILPDNFNLSGNDNKEVKLKLKPPLSANGEYDLKVYVVASPPSSDFCVGSDIKVPVQVTVSNSGIKLGILLVLSVIGAGGILLLQRQQKS
ncbi:MAG: DUF3344 domain-containing protein [Methanosarcinales archaeon]|nr:DUF3344 domain-containing protein [Methanosarcinales archaeon]